ncbi:magnesium transporter [Luteimonas deserti]|uniref:Magnesium transporter MgtE n=1 Tax=Luteimonas deserti TaxID=2752306 RepID=A0A7Z0QQ66_9GAMM|nr:magnesium transporter [Luteimonas deserti]NYZ61936.1 magnesium transporter [Luteimonas deserti]
MPRARSRCLARDDCGLLSSWLDDALPADVADALAHLEPAQAARALPLLAPPQRAAVFGYLPLHMQSGLVAVVPRAALTELLEHMSADERADLFNALPSEQCAQVLPALAQAQREDIRRLSAYGQDTAGAIMTSDYAALAPGLTAQQAVEELRRIAPDAETIYNAYVIDDARHLVGVVTLRRLITAAPDALVADLMQPRPIVAHVGDDQETVAELIGRYDFIALPILDADGRLVGIVTADDAMDVVRAEATEDALLAGGTAGRLAGTVRGATIRQLYRLRVFWLVLLVFGNIFSGAGIAHFEDVIAAHLPLLFFLPLLIASAGNAGSQSATLMVRALATGDVRAQDWSRMLGREVLVAGLLGLTMAVAISAIGLWRGGPDIATVVAITMVIVVLLGSLIGMSLPFALSKFRLDPATASGPLVTSIADVAGVLVYFGIARVVLGS